jgi:hypothetical protein
MPTQHIQDKNQRPRGSSFAAVQIGVFSKVDKANLVENPNDDLFVFPACTSKSFLIVYSLQFIFLVTYE